MMRRPLFAWVIAFPLCASAQPFIDLLHTNVLASPGLDREEVSATLPLQLDTNGRLLVLDPYFVQWHTTTAGDLYSPAHDGLVNETMQGVGGALTYVTPFCSGKWKLAVAGIGKYHWLEEQQHGDIQYGGVLLTSRVFKPTLTVRAGVYANYDAFGWFVVPLLGLDWRIDAKNNLFGILPGTFNYEHKCSPRFHWGASFRAYTTSFGVRDGDYRRLDENPLGLFGDVYFTRSIVLRVEGGWSFIREVLGGPGDPLFDADHTNKNGYADHDIVDSPYARVVLAYRLRLDKPGKP
ncbi:MAG: hypothetical protein ABI432_01160 [Flavobacteriales bacterium]